MFTLSFPIQQSFSERIYPNIEVGLGYNVWMWNWAYDPTCVDVPILGHYNSNNPEVLRTHVYWFDDLNLDFVMVTWRGINNTYAHNTYVNQNAHLFFEVMKNYSQKIQACILVEKTGNETDEATIYDYIYDEFVTLLYPNHYYQYKGKPLIIFFSYFSTIFNATNPLTRDSRFTTVTIGVYSTDEWLYENINYAWYENLTMYITVFGVIIFIAIVGKWMCERF